MTTDKSTYNEGDTIQYTGSGFTPNGEVHPCLTLNATSAICVVNEPNADSSGNVMGSYPIGVNWPPGTQQFWVYDVTTATNSPFVQLTITTVVFDTIPANFVGTVSPGSITACDGTFSDGQSGLCGASFSATANLPSPSTGWEFDHWIWGGGVTCTPSGNTASCTYSSTAGSLTAVYAAEVSFVTNPSTDGSINWGSCSGLGETNGGSVYSTSYGSVPACYVPSGYTLSNWNCSGGLTCSGSNDPTLVSFLGPGTITLNFNTGSLSNPVSTSLTASATPSSVSGGTPFTVSGTLTAKGVGVGGETIVLLFSWSTNIVTTTTLSDGSYSYTVTAPPSAGPYNVDVFFLGDYGGSPQYLPGKATATVTVT